MKRIVAAVCAAALMSACSNVGGVTAIDRPSIRTVMTKLVDPSADGIWEAVSTTETARGSVVRRPAGNAEWAALGRHADRLLEGAALLRTGLPAVAPGEAVADAEIAGTRTGPEIDADIKADPAAFAAAIDGYEKAARAVDAAIDRRDADALLSAGEALDGSCDACHFAYWHPRSAAQAMPSPAEFARHRLR